MNCLQRDSSRSRWRWWRGFSDPVVKRIMDPRHEIMWNCTSLMHTNTTGGRNREHRVFLYEKSYGKRDANGSRFVRLPKCIPRLPMYYASMNVILTTFVFDGPGYNFPVTKPPGDSKWQAMWPVGLCREDDNEMSVFETGEEKTQWGKLTQYSRLGLKPNPNARLGPGLGLQLGSQRWKTWTKLWTNLARV